MLFLILDGDGVANTQLTDLRIFVRIAESGNLTRGAARSFVSAPAASNRIRALEADLNAQLFHRTNRGVRLTRAGEELLQYARTILREVEMMTQHFAGRGDEQGHVRIYANTTAVTEFMPEFLAVFLSERPRITIDLEERLTRDIVRGVQGGAADLGLISGDVDVEGLEAHRLSTDRLVLATAVGHPLVARKELAFADTANFEHVGLHEGSTLLDFLRRQMVRSGYERALRIQVRSFEAMCRMIEADVGIGVVPESAARRYARTMRIEQLRLTDDWAVRDRWVLVRARSALTPSQRVLFDELVRAGVGGSEG